MSMYLWYCSIGTFGTLVQWAKKGQYALQIRREAVAKRIDENRVVVFDCSFDSLAKPQVETWTYDRKEIPSSRAWHLRVGLGMIRLIWHMAVHWHNLTQFVRSQQPVSLRFQQSISAIPPLIANSNGRYAVVRVFLWKCPEAPLDSQDKLVVRGATDGYWINLDESCWRALTGPFVTKCSWHIRERESSSI